MEVSFPWYFSGDAREEILGGFRPNLFDFRSRIKSIEQWHGRRQSVIYWWH